MVGEDLVENERSVLHSLPGVYINLWVLPIFRGFCYTKNVGGPLA